MTTNGKYEITQQTKRLINKAIPNIFANTTTKYIANTNRNYEIFS